MKYKIIALVTAVLLVASFPAFGVYAAEGGEAIVGLGESSVAEPRIVNRVLFDGDYKPYFLQCGGTVTALELDTLAYAFNDWDLIADCEVVWRFDSFDSTTPGRKALVGDVILPEDCVFVGEETLTVEVVVIVYDDSGAPFINLSNCQYTLSGMPVIVPQGATAEEVANLLAKEIDGMDHTAICWTEYGDAFTAPFTIDPSVIDTKTLGTYYPVTVDLPGGITFGGQEHWMTGVHVLPRDEVKMTASSLFLSSYLVQWIYPATNPVLWVSVDGSEWREAERNSSHTKYNEYGIFSPMDGTTAVTELSLYFNHLTSGHEYKFQVQYDGDRFSDVLVLDFTSSGIPKRTNEQGGDRSGIDHGENELPPEGGNPVIPPTGEEKPTTPPIEDGNPVVPPTGEEKPTTPPVDGWQSGSSPTGSVRLDSSPASEPARTQPDLDLVPAGEDVVAPAVSEDAALLSVQLPLSPSPMVPNSPDETDLTISGERLIAMMDANPNHVTFMHGGMWASIPTEYLRELSVADTDTFAVRLEKPTEDSLSAMFFLSGKELEKPFEEPFLLSIPWDGGAVACVLENGEEAVAEISNGKAIFPLTTMGTYRISPKEQVVPVSVTMSSDLQSDTKLEIPTAPVEQYDDSVVPVAVAAGFGLLGVAVYLFLLWRRGRR